MTSIHFNENYITINMDAKVASIDIGDGFKRLNKSTTTEPVTYRSTLIVVYYHADTGHAPRQFPVKVGASFKKGETVTITGGGLQQTTVVATDPEGNEGVWGY